MQLLHTKAPLLVWVVFISTILSFLGGDFLGYNLTGWAWVISLIASLFVIIINPTGINFPVMLWVPWILSVVAYGYYSDYSWLQRSIQILCPIIVGAAVSSCRLDEVHLAKVYDIFKYLAGFIIVLAAIKAVTEIITLTAWAPHVMTVILLCTLFAASYILGQKNDIFWWWLLAIIPFLALTRTAIVVAGLTLPLNFAPMKLKKRILIIVIISLLGTILFYAPRFQKKMFQEGAGEMSDVLNQNFADSGRFYMWKSMDEQIKDSLWFGHGTGSGEAFVRRITQGLSGYPHNDWRLLMYDYGIFGTAVFALTLSIVSLHAYERTRTAYGQQRLFFLVGAFSFIPFALMMYTDNITVYVSFYGNLQFTILGLAYGSEGEERLQAESDKQKVRIRW